MTSNHFYFNCITADDGYTVVVMCDNIAMICNEDITIGELREKISQKMAEQRKYYEGEKASYLAGASTIAPARAPLPASTAELITSTNPDDEIPF